MRRALSGSLYMIAGGLIGIATAVASVDYLGSSPVGAASTWQSFDVSDESAAAFYSNAHYLLGGRLPPAPGQQQEMTARRDNEGNLLLGGCSYLISGESWNHIWWSIATAADNGVKPRVEAMLTSDSAVFNTDDSLWLTVSRAPSPGNWIRPPASGNFVLIFTAAGESGLATQEPLPDLKVTKGSCS